MVRVGHHHVLHEMRRDFQFLPQPRAL